MISVGSRVKTTSDRTFSEIRNCFGTVTEFRKDFGQYGKLWRVKWNNEDTLGLGEYELDCYENQMIEENANTQSTSTQYVNTTPPELNNLEDKIVTTVRGLISNYRVTKSQVADWLTEIASKIRK